MSLIQTLMAVALLVSLLTPPAFSEQWVLNKTSTGGSCTVQTVTSRPQVGGLISGPFENRKDACRDAASKYDSSSSDQGMCWTYGNRTVTGCAKDGVTLPPN